MTQPTDPAAQAQHNGRMDTIPLAAIDLGSNSFRLEIGRFERGHYRRLDYVKDVVRLGAGLDAEGLLREDAVHRGLQTLERFAERLSDFGKQQVRAVATQTLREAGNRDTFLALAGAALGHPIEVISGREEARLIYAGVAQLQPTRQRRLVIDIGGRSTEIILGEGSKPLAVESFGVGSVTLSMRHFPDGHLTEDAFRRAQIDAGAEMEEALGLFPRHGWQEVLGSSGTVAAVSQLLVGSGISDGRVTLPGLTWLIERCIEARQVDRLRLPRLQDDRRPVLAGGLAIFYAALATFGIDSLEPASGALRHGVLAELRDRLLPGRAARARDPRHESIREAQERFAADLQQAQRVHAVARTLHAGADPDAGPEARLELKWACDLHELGMVVSHHDYHRHSAYLVRNLDAAGLSQSQQRRLADMVLGHRGGLRKIADSLSDETFAWQVLCLRLAVIACHARGTVNPRALTLERKVRLAHLGYGARWAQSHPRTLHLLRQEADAWARHGTLKLMLTDAV